MTERTPGQENTVKGFFNIARWGILQQQFPSYLQKNLLYLRQNSTTDLNSGHGTYSYFIA